MSQLSKEEILEKRLGNYAKMFGGSVTVDIFCSMDEWALREIVMFERWKNINKWKLSPLRMGYYQGELNERTRLTPIKKLYSLYKESKNEQR